LGEPLTDSGACLFLPLSQERLNEYKLNKKVLTKDEDRYLHRFRDLISSVALDCRMMRYYVALTEVVGMVVGKVGGKVGGVVKRKASRILIVDIVADSRRLRKKKYKEFNAYLDTIATGCYSSLGN
jgi:hypothetical protein